MTSRITIGIDFENNNQPVIQIIHPLESDDVRDNLLKNFLQSLQGSSSWLKIQWQDRHREGEARIFIRPIKPDQLLEEATIMMEQEKLNQEYKKKISN
jgi:hypothetical protein